MRRKAACRLLKGDPSIQRLLPLWNSLSVEVMSGDETDHTGDRVRYAITKLPWRDPAISAWMKTFDLLHLSTRFTQNRRATRGAYPHVRFLSDRIERHYKPVAGLPINFYHQGWLESLEEYQRDALNIQPAVDLTFTATIQR
jgi:hypothetical protein